MEDTLNTYDWASDAEVNEEGPWAPEPTPFDDLEPVTETALAVVAPSDQPVMVDPHNLRPHPLNKQVYGNTEPPAELVDSIRRGWAASSILEALPDGTLIKGHLRRHAAMLVALETVPVLYRPDLTDDEQAQVDELLRDNAGRIKTTEIRCREWRLAFTSFKGDVGSVAGQKSRDVVAQRFGISGVTLEHGIIVVNYLDGRGLPDEHDKVRTVLNTRGVEPAWKLVRRQDAQKDTQDEAEPSFEGDGATALAIAPAKRHKALQDVLKAVDDRLPLLADPEALVKAIPQENLDATLAEVQTLLSLLGNVEAEIRDRLDAGRRSGRRKKSGA